MAKQKKAKDIAYDRKIEKLLEEQEDRSSAIPRKVYDWLFRIAFDDKKRTKEQKARAMAIMTTRKLE